MPWRAAMSTNRASRPWNPRWSCAQSRSCKKTRTALNPLDWAQPSSVSMRPGSKVSAWNISSWLMALDVM